MNFPFVDPSNPPRIVLCLYLIFFLVPTLYPVFRARQLDPFSYCLSLPIIQPGHSGIGLISLLG